MDDSTLGFFIELQSALCVSSANHILQNGTGPTGTSISAPGIGLAGCYEFITVKNQYTFTQRRIQMNQWLQAMD
jgi:hypothetical protein